MVLDNKDEAKGQLQPNSESENKSSDAYGGLIRGLTTEELSQTGTQKLILNDLDKKESKIRELEPYRDKFYTVFTEKSILDEKLSKSKHAENLYIVGTTIGGILIGLACNYIKTDGTLATILGIVGFALLVGGIIFKFKK